jgi:iron(III) transport system permease protein
MALDRTGTATPSRIEGFDRAIPVWLLAAGALLLLILLPLGWLAYMSVSGERGLTLAHYARVFTDPRLGRALWNTVVLAFWSGLLSLAIGAPMAWLTARTDLPGPRLMRSLVMASFVTPPFLGAFAWVMLAGPNAGYLNKVYRSLTGSPDPLVNIFTMPGLIFVVALYTFPYAYIMVVNTLELIASDMEEAAAILGASRVWVAVTITLPMVLPAILSGFILSVLQALALFGSPAILALPAGFHTITTQIWALFQYPPKMEMAAAFSMPLLLATALLLFAQKRILGRRGYAAVGGKGGQRRRIPLGLWRYPRSAPASRSWRAPSSCRTACSPRPPSPARGPSPSPGRTSPSPTGRSCSCRRPRGPPSSTRSSWACSRPASARRSPPCWRTSPAAS